MTAIIFALLSIIGVPIAFVLLATSLAYIQLSGNAVLFRSFLQQFFSGIEKYGLMAIPLFMLAGEIMNRGGLIRRLIGLASIFVSGLRGGLAYINLLAAIDLIVSKFRSELFPTTELRRALLIDRLLGGLRQSKKSLW